MENSEATPTRFLQRHIWLLLEFTLKWAAYPIEALSLRQTETIEIDKNSSIRLLYTM